MKRRRQMDGVFNYAKFLGRFLKVSCFIDILHLYFENWYQNVITEVKKIS